MPTHEPVLTAEVLGFLIPERGGIFVDCTVGAGGHARALLEAGASRVVALDRDEQALSISRERLASFAGRVEFVHADFRSLEAVLDGRGLAWIDGAVADLGVSSMQLEDEGRGFSFQRDEPLDMRMDRSLGPTAAELIARAGERELADVIFEYGEERHSRRVARAIVHERSREPIATTGHLARVVRRALPNRGWSRIDPATRTFQAVRIWVNSELEHLDGFVRSACARLAGDGRLVVISFHSLEDRIVKHTLRELEHGGQPGLRVLTRKPVRPGEAELARNPRARSAKLRAAERSQVATGASAVGSASPGGE
jgi:16S rRNA (cytosine1402-N4)-methyltransferase